jgi:hypothetical protein
MAFTGKMEGRMMGGTSTIENLRPSMVGIVFEVAETLQAIVGGEANYLKLFSR